MKLIWKTYSCLFFIMAVNDTLQLLNEKSSVWVFYHMTMAFSNRFAVFYALNLFNAMISGFVGVFILAYAFKMKDLPKLPVWLLCLRLFSDCTGHSYGWEIIKSGFSQGQLAGLTGVVVWALPIVPSYLIQWRMTFAQKEAP
ncbi:MAG: hypothetical protein KGI24_09775 [Candidatus Omnitrophica bacterium]|nr:hypothetical protein [Candidatus Omnitrophota bacterium]MDE2214389.1 hypothetical protein [Candidatus Omnitrophota bacterium]MDE2231021.1 hypothetical protein [Candidatus Omnitrophota bacterium]